VSRQVFLFGKSLFIVLLGFAVIDRLLSPIGRVTEVNAYRIRHGMTLQEVEAILGGPAQGGFICGPEGRSVCIWGNEEIQIEVQFGPNGKVIHVQVPRAPTPYLLEWIQSWIGC
jgi:hypothetical protein